MTRKSEDCKRFLSESLLCSSTYLGVVKIYVSSYLIVTNCKFAWACYCSVQTFYFLDNVPGFRWQTSANVLAQLPYDDFFIRNFPGLGVQRNLIFGHGPMDYYSVSTSHINYSLQKCFTTVKLGILGSNNSN